MDNAATRDPSTATVIEAHHNAQQGLAVKDVELAFIELVQAQRMYGIEIFDCMVVDETDDHDACNTTIGIGTADNTIDQTCTVGVCAHGINIYHQETACSSEHAWSAIKNVACVKKRLILTLVQAHGEPYAGGIIEPAPSTTTATMITLTFASKSACKAVWKRAFELHSRELDHGYCTSSSSFLCML